jgi:ATP-dependent helicase/nuclease subunit A
VNVALAIPASLRERQRQASDPRSSAWVSANAGSGKTHVLTQRVLRLLLKGTPPGQILCLTFTKAAAANMAIRIFRDLAHWTSLDDQALAAAIVAAGAENPGPLELRFARQLFARTVETPGGLRIQTLHAFCERLLKLFPFEANVPAHFKVIDERETQTLMTAARDRAIAALKASAGTADALALAAREVGVFQFKALIAEAQGFAATLEALDTATYAAALRSQLRLAPGATVASLEDEMFGGDIGRRRREAWAQKLEDGQRKDCELAARLRAANSEERRPALIDSLLGAFFTDQGEPRRRLTGGGLRNVYPDLETDLRREQDRLIALREVWRTAQTAERSVALFAVARMILATFAEAKAESGQLDFADQIARALALVTRSSAAWVLEKLDYRLDHLLVDEAQDTSAEQWTILAALCAEFFAGKSARETERTVFAVGDEKQSIFSFQGAAPEKFADMRRFFEARHRQSSRPFARVPLNFSFRSSQTILDAVDETFRFDSARDGLAADGEPPLLHQAVRSEMKGVVELWPTLKVAAETDPADWLLPLDEPACADPAVKLAGRIAETIKAWLSPQARDRIVDPKSGGTRRIGDGDVMILVRSRNAFFEAMIRALKERRVKVAGADRLMLRDHIAVMDLLAAGKAALLPEDDLTLACVLKSPLIGLGEDDLFALAATRRGSLAAALRAAGDERARQAARRLACWRGWARTHSPYAFYARLLGEDGGRKALFGRLGPDAADPIDEFLALALAHERRGAPSLHRFLAEVAATDAPVKRDMEGEGEGVRVLTVHASKGLEAPIVFLPDACGAPDGRHDPKLLPLAPAFPGGPPLFAWSRKAGDDCPPLAEARAQRRRSEAAEHRRLLYVAMTRAGQRLIVAGYETAKGKAADCWHELVSHGLKHSMAQAPAPWDEHETILKMGEGLCAEPGGEEPQRAEPIQPPAWLSTRVMPEAPPRLTRPSSARLQHDGEGERAFEGRLGHTLLQMLPELPAARRQDAARAYLAANAPRLGEVARDALAAQALAVIEAPHLAPLFGPGSRGEVAIAGVLRRADKADLPFSGRLDRVLVTATEVTIVDFKLGAPPACPAEAHIAQLALYRAALQPLYPSLPVRAALIYFEGPTLQPIDEAALAAALDGVGVS